MIEPLLAIPLLLASIRFEDSAQNLFMKCQWTQFLSYETEETFDQAWKKLTPVQKLDTIQCVEYVEGFVNGVTFERFGLFCTPIVLDDAVSAYVNWAKTHLDDLPEMPKYVALLAALEYKFGCDILTPKEKEEKRL